MKSRARRDFGVLGHLEKWSDFQAAGLYRLVIEYNILFNIGAKTYIIRLIKEFNTRIYILVPLLLINIASREAKLLGFSKRIIIYTIDNRDIYTLNLSKV